MEQKRGLLIMAPTGAGKTKWLDSLDPEMKEYWLDGDVVLERHRVKNRNYFWYRDGLDKERQEIADVFEHYLRAGKNILYSGNPLLLIPDLVVIPKKETRWKRLKEREKYGGWAPDREQFEREERAYETASETVRTLRGDVSALNRLIK